MTSPTAALPFLSVENLSLAVPGDPRPVTIVEDVSFAIEVRQTVGLVGESGSGKTMSALAIADLMPSGSQTTGTINLAGRSLLELSDRERESLRGSTIAMVFQDPTSALNPVFTVEKQLRSILRVHHNLRGRQAKTEIASLLTRVGLNEVETVMKSFPHQLSGGMCQRVMIAMALACRPQLLIADEPTTALDVTVQAGIISLLKELADTENLSVLFISHDLGVVSQICEAVVVMYAGQVVEVGSTQQVMRDPAHPYTKALIDCAPDLSEVGIVRSGIPGQPPPAGQAPPGCRFRARCTLATKDCEKDQVLQDLGEQRQVRCWRGGDLGSSTFASRQAAPALSATLGIEADPTLENEVTGSSSSRLPSRGF